MPRLALVCLGLAPACVGSDGESGEFVDYHVAGGLKPCADTPRFVDGFVPMLADQLGLEIDAKVDYYWMDGAEYAKTACGPGTVGCQIGDQVYARNPNLLHEVVHAVTEQGGMNNLPFFTEGVAVTYDPWYGRGAGPRYKFKPAPGEREADPREQMTLPAGEISYDLAGSFVSFLLLRHGQEKFVTMTRELVAGIDYPEISRIFGAVYGVSLDDEVDLFIANDYCDAERANLSIYDCSGPEEGWEGGGWSWESAMECEAEGVAGGAGDPAMSSISQRSVALTVPASGQYDLAVKVTGGGTVTTTVGRCFGCPWAPRDIVVKDGGSLAVDLTPGRHFVRITAVAPEMPRVAVTLTPRGE